jgi:hypothetical protein
MSDLAVLIRLDEITNLADTKVKTPMHQMKLLQCDGRAMAAQISQYQHKVGSTLHATDITPIRSPYPSGSEKILKFAVSNNVSCEYFSRRRAPKLRGKADMDLRNHGHTSQNCITVATANVESRVVALPPFSH